MLISLQIAVLLLLAGVVVAFASIVIAGFRTSVAWGLMALLAPFGTPIFSLLHWSKAGIRYLLMMASLVGYFAASLWMIGTYPELAAPMVKKYPQLEPGLRLAVRTVGGFTPKDPKVAAEQASLNKEKLINQRDELTSLEDAYDKHAVELHAAYLRLQTDRANLKGNTGPALTAYNAKAAQYQEGVNSLAAEKARIDALQQTIKLTAAAAVPPKR